MTKATRMLAVKIPVKPEMTRILPIRTRSKPASMPMKSSRSMSKKPTMTVIWERVRGICSNIMIELYIISFGCREGLTFV